MWTDMFTGFIFLYFCVPVRPGPGPAAWRAWEDSPRDLDEWTTRHQHCYPEPQQILLSCSQAAGGEDRCADRRRSARSALKQRLPYGWMWQLCLGPGSSLTEQEGFQTSQRRSCRLNTLLLGQQCLNSGALVKTEPNVIVCLSLWSQAGNTFIVCANAAIKWFIPAPKEIYSNLN